MTILFQSYAIKRMKCEKCGEVPHKIFPLTGKAECTFCHDVRDLRTDEQLAVMEPLKYGAPERA